MARNQYSDMVDGLDDSHLDQLRRAVDVRRCRDERGFGTWAEAADHFQVPRPRCPNCGSERSHRDGMTPVGARRLRCASCGKVFGTPAGTALEGSRCELPAMADFVTMMRYGAQLDAIAESLGITHRTAWEWRHRVFASTRGYQDKIVLRDRVWIDETFIDDRDLAIGRKVERKTGLSKQKVCICVAIDVHKNVAAVVAGNGKPSGERVKKALAGRIEEGSVLIGDKEKAHRALARAVKAKEHITYKADPKDPVYLKEMALVNNMCAWIKRYLRRFLGMSMKYLQDYLDFYTYLFRVNQARDTWEPTDRILRHMLMTPAEFKIGKR